MLLSVKTGTTEIYLMWRKSRVVKTIFLRKATERLEVAKDSLLKGYLNAAASNCYYSLFNAMQSILHKPSENRWRHGGIAKSFCRKVYRDSNLGGLRKHIDGLVDLASQLYALREIADYREEMIVDKEEILDYIERVEMLLKDIKLISKEGK